MDFFMILHAFNSIYFTRFLRSNIITTHKLASRGYIKRTPTWYRNRDVVLFKSDAMARLFGRRSDVSARSVVYLRSRFKFGAPDVRNDLCRDN